VFGAHARCATTREIPATAAGSAEPHRRRRSSRASRQDHSIHRRRGGPPRVDHPWARTQAGARNEPKSL